jgi:hypothetical protein
MRRRAYLSFSGFLCTDKMIAIIELGLELFEAEFASNLRVSVMSIRRAPKIGFESQSEWIKMVLWMTLSRNLPDYPTTCGPPARGRKFGPQLLDSSSQKKMCDVPPAGT